VEAREASAEKCLIPNAHKPLDRPDPKSGVVAEEDRREDP
jgi:hypothetical protein